MSPFFKLKPIYQAISSVMMVLPLLAHAATDSVVTTDSTANTTAATNVVETEDISVFGQGQTRQVQNITQADLQEAPAGTSPLKALEKLPGVHFESSDPWGSYEWSTRFSIRGFSQQQLGFTLDDVPLGDMSYGNNNGLHISRAIAPENIAVTTVAQGSGALGTASTSNLGGTVQFTSSDPYDKAQVSGGQTLGSSNTTRTFVRLDTGNLGADTKAYFSLSHNGADKWKGAGPQTQDQFNSKLVHKLGNGSLLSAFFNVSRRDETDYADFSLDSQKRLGWGWDNYQPDFQRAVNAANGIFTGGVTSVDDAYYLGRGLRNDELGGFTANLRLTDSLRLKSTLYTHHNKGEGQWYTPYVASSATMPISVRTTEYGIRREGLNTALTYLAGQHTIMGGVWLEHSVHDLARRYYAITGAEDTDYFLTNPFRTDFQQRFTTVTRQLFLQDTVSMLDDRLTLAFGVKSPNVSIDSVSQVGTRAAGSLSSKGVLPQVSMNYALTPRDDLFASYSENLRAFQPGVTGPFSASQTAYDATVASLKPEESKTFDIGVRTKRDNVQASLALYDVEFSNRLLNISQCAGIVGCATSLANVGKVSTRGAEAAVLWMPVKHISWLNTLTFNDSKYQSDYVNGTTVVNTAGKTVVDAPKVMFGTELGYESNGYFARVSGKYTDKRYITYTNDSQVPSYWVWNLGVGYGQKNLSGIKDFRVQLNVTNILDNKYFSTVGSNGFVASDPTGQNYTLQEGAPRQVFLTVSGKY
jgi:iron complex outermembrane receptor protein